MQAAFAPAPAEPKAATAPVAGTPAGKRPRPAWEHELDRAAARTLRRACACGGTCGGCGDGTAPASVHDVLRRAGRPLEPDVRDTMERRLGHDLAGVRIHEGGPAAASARDVGALAYTVGRDVVFGGGQYAPRTAAGERLLVHELTHVLQQRGTGDRDGPIAVGRPDDPAEAEADRVAGGSGPAATGTAPRRLSRACGPAVPTGGSCVGQSGEVAGDLFQFVVNCDDPLPAEDVRLRLFAGTVSSGDTVEVHGFASVDGPAAFNEELSCARAERAQSILAAEFTAHGIAATTSLFKHGPTPGPAADRRSVVLVRNSAPPPRPSCSGHVVGSRGRCASGTDFTFHDFPSLSLTHDILVTPFRLLSDTQLLFLMESSVTGVGTLAGTPGSDAVAQFASGSGTTVTHGPTSPLGALALGSGSFATALATVQAEIEAELSAQAASGTIDCLALSLPAGRLPAIAFGFSDGLPIKAVIGGTQGLVVSLTSFTADATARTYTIGLRFEICDDFGVDTADLYSESLIAFWVLQHERAGFRPFVNLLNLTTRVTGTF